jgi:uncharacterized protein involved in exopolysaccharide biosynthesis
MTQQFDPMAAVRTHWRLLPLLALMGALLLGTFYFLQPPRYTSTATVQYSHQDPTAGLTGQQANYGDPERTLATQRDIVLSDRVLAPVVEATSMSRPDLLSALRVSTETGNDVLRISAEDTSAARASQLAKAVVDAYVNHNRALGKQRLEAQAEALSPLIADLQPRARCARVRVTSSARRRSLPPSPSWAPSSSSSSRCALRRLPTRAGLRARGPRGAEGTELPVLADGAVLGALLGLGLAILVALVKGSLRQRRHERDDLVVGRPDLSRPARVVRRRAEEVG